MTEEMWDSGTVLDVSVQGLARLVTELMQIPGGNQAVSVVGSYTLSKFTPKLFGGLTQNTDMFAVLVSQAQYAWLTETLTRDELNRAYGYPDSAIRVGTVYNAG